MYQGHRVQQVTQVHKSPEEGGAKVTTHCRFECMRRAGGDVPANQTEPWEAVVEGVAPAQSVVTVLHAAAGELRGPVVHFPHQVQPLSAVRSTKREEKATCKTGSIIVD